MLQNRTIYLATDHAGFSHKEAVRDWLIEAGYAVIDCGATIYDEGDDFPDYISKASRAVAENPQSNIAIIFGGSGEGEAMVANRYKGVRATVYYGGEESIITLSREHNDANVLSIGARFVSLEQTKKVIDSWLGTPHSQDPKYHRRNVKIDAR